MTPFQGFVSYTLEALQQAWSARLLDKRRKQLGSFLFFFFFFSIFVFHSWQLSFRTREIFQGWPVHIDHAITRPSSPHQDSLKKYLFHGSSDNGVCQFLCFSRQFPSFHQILKSQTRNRLNSCCSSCAAVDIELESFSKTLFAHRLQAWRSMVLFPATVACEGQSSVIY